MTRRRRLDVNLHELDQIIDRGQRTPLSESEGEKLKTALHAMAERLLQKRSTEKTSAVLPPDTAPAGKPDTSESAPAGHEASERDRRSEVAPFLQVPEQLKAVHARHDQIRNDDVCVEGNEPFQRFLPVARDLRVKGTIRKHGSQGGTLALVIVDDENPA
jgi:hypothetical protein